MQTACQADYLTLGHWLLTKLCISFFPWSPQTLKVFFLICRAVFCFVCFNKNSQHKPIQNNQSNKQVHFFRRTKSRFPIMDLFCLLRLINNLASFSQTSLKKTPSSSVIAVECFYFSFKAKTAHYSWITLNNITEVLRTTIMCTP